MFSVFYRQRLKDFQFREREKLYLIHVILIVEEKHISIFNYAPIKYLPKSIKIVCS